MDLVGFKYDVLCPTKPLLLVRESLTLCIKYRLLREGHPSTILSWDLPLIHTFRGRVCDTRSSPAGLG